MAKILWHPAFCGAMQLELNEYRDVLEFKDEYQLTKGPLRVDILIIKKRKDIVIDKNIARNFRHHNIIEYKSPDDTLDIADYHKTLSYKFFYAYREKIDIEDLSVTLVTSQHPYNLLKRLSGRYTMTSNRNGIYVVDHDTEPVQIIVSSELEENENIWLTHLNKELTAVRFRNLLTEAAKHGKDIVLDAYLNVVTDANIEAFQEANMLGEKAEQCLKDLGYVDKWRAEGRDEGRDEGRAEGEAKGEAKGKAEMIIRILSRRLETPSESLQKKINSIREIAKLDELADFALTCVSLDEFATALE
ncbi:MAG: DUF4351 domain-containing protein [Planctomycetaceae bacterium]|jgi:hypothetical protein|nr:DUF4351 domain-containing protein [Planctomycetaceae bacterium]